MNTLLPTRTDNPSTTRTGEALDWHTALTNALTPSSPRLGIKRHLLQKLTQHTFLHAKLDSTQPEDHTRRERLLNRQKEVNLAIVRGEIELRKHDPEFARKFPGGRLNQKTLEQIQELRDYLSEGLTTMQNSLLRQKAFDCENKWFCHKTHRATQYLTLLNVNYNPDEPRDELGKWTTEGDSSKTGDGQTPPNSTQSTTTTQSQQQKGKIPDHPFVQTKFASCGPTAVRTVIEIATGKDPGDQAILDQMADAINQHGKKWDDQDKQGGTPGSFLDPASQERRTGVYAITSVLQKNGVDTIVKPNTSAMELAYYLEGHSEAAIIRVAHPDDMDGVGHLVAVQRDENGNFRVTNIVHNGETTTYPFKEFQWGQLEGGKDKNGKEIQWKIDPRFPAILTKPHEN